MHGRRSGRKWTICFGQRYSGQARKQLAEHDFTRHGQDEYGRGTVHTNTVEGFYSICKRGMKGDYEHCGKQNLHRYAAEFDFAITIAKRTVLMTPKGFPWHCPPSLAKDFFTGTRWARRICAGGAEHDRRYKLHIQN